MSARTAVLGGLAVLLLTVLSLAALGAEPDHHRRAGRMSYAAACAPGDVAGTRVDVRLGERMMMRGWLHADRTVVPAGRVTLVAANVGRLLHELVVLPLRRGEHAGDRVVGSDDEVDEGDAIAEASADCAEGTGDGIRPGGAGWVTVRLAPGRYELVCNLPGHYRAGMVEEIAVRRPHPSR
jgi:uncharacterized cupredoxin-like copper-binding protein